MFVTMACGVGMAEFFCAVIAQVTVARPIMAAPSPLDLFCAEVQRIYGGTDHAAQLAGLAWLNEFRRGQVW